VATPVPDSRYSSSEPVQIQLGKRAKVREVAALGATGQAELEQRTGTAHGRLQSIALSAVDTPGFSHAMKAEAAPNEPEGEQCRRDEIRGTSGVDRRE
jgi:hypothetical protein